MANVHLAVDAHLAVNVHLAVDVHLAAHVFLAVDVHLTVDVHLAVDAHLAANVHLPLDALLVDEWIAHVVHLLTLPLSRVRLPAPPLRFRAQREHLETLSSAFT